MGKKGFLSFLFLGLLVASPVMAQDCINPNGDEGVLLYHQDYGVFMGCTADGWKAFHLATRTPPPPACKLGLAIGESCDGVWYIGERGGHRIYAAAADEPTLLQWSTEGINTGAASFDDGLSNTNILVGLAGSYPAAEACRNLGPDWYLPARNELNLIWTQLTGGQRTAMGINTTGIWTPGWYWSSSEEGDDWHVSDQSFYDGTISGHGKTASISVRCVRR